MKNKIVSYFLNLVFYFITVTFRLDNSSKKRLIRNEIGLFVNYNKLKAILYNNMICNRVLMLNENAKIKAK